MNATSNKPACDFHECERPAHGYSPYCKAHYMQDRAGRGLKPIQPWNRALPTEERFWQKVDRRSPEECWEWKAAVNTHGYGFLKHGTGPKHAHRVAYFLTHGEVPREVEIDHICRNRICVNPSHLRPATPKENRENHGGPQVNNTSGYRGVSWSKARNGWLAVVTDSGRHHQCGLFSTREEAAEAARLKRVELWTRNEHDRKTA